VHYSLPLFPRRRVPISSLSFGARIRKRQQPAANARLVDGATRGPRSFHRRGRHSLAIAESGTSRYRPSFSGRRLSERILTRVGCYRVNSTLCVGMTRRSYQQTALLVAEPVANTSASKGRAIWIAKRSRPRESAPIAQVTRARAEPGHYPHVLPLGAECAPRCNSSEESQR
jgi:hypothetical protein